MISNNIDTTNIEVKTKNAKLLNSLNENIKMFKNIFSDDQTIVFREFEDRNNNIKYCIIYANGMAKKEMINDDVLRPIMANSPKASLSPNNILDFLIMRVIFCSDIKRESNVSNLTTAINYGNTILLVDGCTEALIINTIDLKSRGIEEPSSEVVVRGPKDGFTEGLSTNVTLLKRRINTIDLKFQNKEIGVRTKTRVCICYIEGIAQEQILQELNKRLDSIKVDSVLSSGHIDELIKDSPLSPFKTIGSTERPDVVAGKLLEGRIAILCEGTPFALTVPELFLERFQSPDDYNNHFVYASFNRGLRYIGIFLTTSVPAIYTALVTFHQELIPTPLITGIYQSRRGVPLPTVVEALLMMLIFEILREAGARMPKNVGQAVGIVGALVLGDAAVNARLVSAPMVIVTALTGISSFLVPQMMGMISIRILLLLLASFLGIYGYFFGVMGITIHMMSLKSFGIPFMLNLGTGPLKADDLKDTAIRAPWFLMNFRPRLIAKDLIRSMRKNKNERR